MVVSAVLCGVWMASEGMMAVDLVTIDGDGVSSLCIMAWCMSSKSVGNERRRRW